MNRGKIKNLALIAAVIGLTCSAQAAWYWPFDFDPDSTNKPPRLHRLLEKANEYIELAEDEALEGNGDKAIANYRLALGELDRVEEENPDRAESQEFAPLRNKRASCTAAIDAIRFAQVNENERAVSVTNTRELEKKWRKKHNMQTPEDLAEERRAAEEAKLRKKEAEKTAEPEAKNIAGNAEKKSKPEKAVKSEKSSGSESVPEATTDVLPQKAEERDSRDVSLPAAAPAPQPARDDMALDRLVARTEAAAAKTQARAIGAEKSQGLVPPTAQRPYAERLKLAMAELRGGDYAAADILLEGLMKERPDDLNTLLLRAAAQTGLGSNYAARRTLEKAMKAHPKSYLPCYNLAGLTLRLGENAESARQYYEKGRALGGPRNEELEKLLK